MNLPNIVAVCAPSRRSGKGTVSAVLTEEFGYTEMMFAGPIKVMWAALCMDAGMDKETLGRTLAGDLKETPIEMLAGLSLRTFAEGIGTDWGRKMVRQDLWLELGRQKMLSALAKGKRLVVSDVRFPNEADLVRYLGGIVVNVERPVENGGLLPTLASEGHLKDYGFDYIFVNDSSISNLQAAVRNLMRLVEQPA